MNRGMSSDEILLERYPSACDRQPLSYAALAAQKSYLSLHLTGLCCDPRQAAWLEEAFAGAGKRLDMGKACVRFRSLDDLPLEVIGRAIASTSPERLIEQYEASRRRG